MSLTMASVPRWERTSPIRSGESSALCSELSIPLPLSPATMPISSPPATALSLPMLHPNSALQTPQNAEVGGEEPPHRTSKASQPTRRILEQETSRGQMFSSRRPSPPHQPPQPVGLHRPASLPCPSICPHSTTLHPYAKPAHYPVHTREAGDAHPAVCPNQQTDHDQAVQGEADSGTHSCGLPLRQH